MSDIKPTKEQSDVINHQYPGNFLVSASAGSGKTMVLVQRIIKWLGLDQSQTIKRDPQNKNNTNLKPAQNQIRSSKQYQYPNDINHLLIVTFTRAAAKEMQERIQKGIRKTIQTLRKSSASNNLLLIQHLYRQLNKVPVADIGTLDAFCQKLVTHYYYIIGLDPQFRIMTDTAEVEMTRDLVWKQVREQLYTKDHNLKEPKFEQLVQNFDNQINSDDNLTDLIYRVYNYSQAKAHPNQWLASLPNLYQVRTSLTQSQFYQQDLYPVIHQELAQALNELYKAKTIAKDNQLTREAQQLAENYGVVSKMCQDLEITKKEPRTNHDQNWDSISSQLRDYNFGTFPRVNKKYTSQQKQAHGDVKKYRDTGKKILDKQVSKFFAQNAQDNLHLMKQATSLIQEIVKTVQAFSKAYQQQKRQKRAFEFSDIEHMALQILTPQQCPKDERKESQDVKNQLQNYFDEILVDECQDNNQLQNQILTTLAKPDYGQTATNLFMVGDPKQSIYRFRLADPGWFTAKQQQYESPSDHINHLRRLTYNFRSTQNIDQFVNLIFNRIMNGYYPKEQLRFKADYYQPVAKQLNVPVQMMIYDSSTKPNPNLNQAPNHNSEAMNPQFELEDGAHGQIKLIAQKIKAMLDNQTQIYENQASSKLRPIEPKDIALISATRNDNLIIANFFRHYGIPVTLDGTQNYFKTTEIQIMMSLLQIIDNPYQDIPLVAVLRSPIVGLDENQLADLRINAKTGDYYHAVISFYQRGQKQSLSDYEAHLWQSIKHFLNQLDYFRSVAKQHGLVDLIWLIYQKTGFLDYVGGMPNGKQRQANLHALYERAADYEQSNFRGLFQFINFIHRMQDQDNDLAEAESNQTSNAVTVTTIHGSKGLQFPVVFLYDVSHNFNNTDLNKQYLINKKGLGISCFQPHEYTMLRPLQKQIITAYEKDQSLAEEQRKLYVALTRTEQRLFLVGTTRDKPKQKILNSWKAHASADPDHAPLLKAFKVKSYLNWLGTVMYSQLNLNPIQNQDGLCSYQSKNNAPADFKITFYDYSRVFGNQETSTPNQDHKQWLNNFKQRAKQYFQHHQSTPMMKKMNYIMNFKYPYQEATQEAAYQSVSALRQAFEDPDDSEMSNYHQNHGRPINQYISSNFAQPKFMTQQKQQPPKATDVGTATHLVLQMIPLNPRPTLERIQHLIKKLVKYQMIDPAVAKLINQHNILSFFKSSLGQKILQNPHDYYRETPFSLLVNADQAFPNQKQKSKHDKVLVHGIIDGYLFNRNQVILVDYKTDYVDRHHLTASEAKIKQRYREQLKLYAIALEKALQVPVKAKYLYLLNIQKLVPIN